MRKFKNFWRDEDGVVAVVVALCMVMLMGFTSLAVDYGTLASNRQRLQNAADAAALAGASRLSESRSRLETERAVKEYARKNGADDCTVLTTILWDKVTVKLTREVPTALSVVLTGRSRETVSASATAEVNTIFGVYPYALFAGESIEEGSGIVGTGQGITIASPIHSNSNIDLKHGELVNGATATAVGSTGHSGGGWGTAPEIPLPDYELIRGRFPNVYVAPETDVVLKKSDNLNAFVWRAIVAKCYEPGVTLASLRRDGLTIYVRGSMTFNGNDSFTLTDVPVNLIVHGNVKLNGCAISSTPELPFCLISEEGDITVTCGGADYYGIIFAPNGDVDFGGNNASFYGSIIAQNIRKTGGKLYAEYFDGADDFMPKRKVHLVE